MITILSPTFHITEKTTQLSNTTLSTIDGYPIFLNHLHKFIVLLQNKKKLTHILFNKLQYILKSRNLRFSIQKSFTFQQPIHKKLQLGSPLIQKQVHNTIFFFILFHRNNLNPHNSDVYIIYLPTNYNTSTSPISI